MKRVVILDFGGVVAEEGFRDGLKAIARINGLDEETFFRRARDLIYQTGYVTGKGDEHAYWQSVRVEFGLTTSDEELRGQILQRFVVRPEMLAEVADLRSLGHTVALLTDQTDWLNDINREYGMRILAPFQFVFNSYDLHMSKRELQLFHYVEQILETAPKDMLFVDDNPDNVQMATGIGWHTILFLSYRAFREELSRYLRND